jgi:hypothetical protein
VVVNTQLRDRSPNNVTRRACIRGRCALTPRESASCTKAACIRLRHSFRGAAYAGNLTLQGRARLRQG